MTTRPRVGVSSCLLGHPVRYDGLTKGVPWVEGELSARVEVVPICPETGAGMPVPRPAIELVQHPSGGLRAELVVGEGDVHSALEKFCESMQKQLGATPLHGYLLKAQSPSCGVIDTPHFSESREVLRRGAGLWTQVVLTHWPDLPIADESEIQSEADRAEFLRRVHEYWHSQRRG